jgi:hypothetical protein
VLFGAVQVANSDCKESENPSVKIMETNKIVPNFKGFLSCLSIEI